MPRDQWFNIFEEELSRLEAFGLPPERAYELATQRAGSLLSESLADRADDLRRAAKDEAL